MLRMCLPRKLVAFRTARSMIRMDKHETYSRYCVLGCLLSVGEITRRCEFTGFEFFLAPPQPIKSGKLTSFIRTKSPHNVRRSIWLLCLKKVWRD